MLKFVSTVASHWLGFVILIHLGLFILQMHVLLPIEDLLLGHLSLYASVLFLPHASRVLAAWLLGPKALFALVPAEVFFTYALVSEPVFGISILTTILVPAIAAASPVIAFEAMRIAGIDVYPSATRKPNWRAVIFAGCVASVINSISGTLIKTYALPSNSIFEIIARYFIGDTVGLFIVMLVLMFVLRRLERKGSIA